MNYPGIRGSLLDLVSTVFRLDNKIPIPILFSSCSWNIAYIFQLPERLNLDYYSNVTCSNDSLVLMVYCATAEDMHLDLPPKNRTP